MSNIDKLILPLSFALNDTFLICDGAWCLLFERFYINYRLHSKNIHDVAKIKVVAIKRNEYGLRLMEVTPEDDRVIIPVFADSIQYHDLYYIHLAMALSHRRKHVKQKTD